MTEEKLSSINIANMDIIYWSVSLSSRRLGDDKKGVDGGYRNFSRFTRKYENPV